MIDRAAIAEQVGDAPVIGDVDGNCDRIQPFGDGIEPLGVAGGDNDMRAFRFPASSAVARPMPDEPPTTTTFLPVSAIWFPLLCCDE